MKLHNTLTKQIEEITVDSGKLRMYSCGPTVYDRAHIGNLASFIFADTLRRVISFNGIEVRHVMNFTDVDDKTITRSRELSPDLEPLDALHKLTEACTNDFLADMTAVGNDVTAITFVKATDNIAAMQKLINELYTAKVAYIADDGVYFSIDAYRKQGRTYGQLTEISTDSTSQARIQNDEYDKESIHDFALWKKQKSGEPAWKFEIDGIDMTGRPGWHLECSAMSKAELGQPFDIHTGGIDLIFPHHENEIAQSTAAVDDQVYARYFLHNEHLLIDGRKMSKSLNNFYTLQTIVDRGFDPLAFRLLVLQANYRSQAHFSWENLQAAQNRLNDFRAMAALRWQTLPATHDAGTFALEEVPNTLVDYLNDDLDTPQALAFLSQVSTQLQTVLIENDMLDHFETMIQGVDDLLGLNLMAVGDITQDQKQLLAARTQARDDNDWTRADEIRDQLLADGIGVRDTGEGSIWFPASSPAQT